MVHGIFKKIFKLFLSRQRNKTLFLQPEFFQKKQQ